MLLEDCSPAAMSRRAYGDRAIPLQPLIAWSFWYAELAILAPNPSANRIEVAPFISLQVSHYRAWSTGP
ncbi:hypothetical protein GE300_09595 [Rhodobacteraceae bacterium 2CG4]|uniref:Uncharacterized protein n=1 Tax=Halovulum marinum TaxID=2662447 RepID=A0A6L5Z196_9RHOB|nr:hypothetical protein [Halovulum marinum]MSU89862.1 hypothetical protein [Halovulum marinum]